jgi:hypothetical protein
MLIARILVMRYLRRSRRLISRQMLSRSQEYIDSWQESTVKPKDFYEYHAKDKPKKYFYAIDLQGRVFLEETLPKNIATSIKSASFLDFFFSNLRRSSERDLKFLPKDCRRDYPFVSLCGVERSFLRPADSAVVFHTIEKSVDGSTKLWYGGSLCQSFDPRRLALSKRTGRLYHELVNDSGTHLHSKEASFEHPNFGLIKSTVAVALSDQIVPGSLGDGGNEEFSGMDFMVDEKLRYPIRCLPEYAELGPWAMPYIEE